MTSILPPRADATAASEPLHHFRSVCAGAGRAAKGLRASWQERLRQVTEGCGFRYVRFHGLFHDDMFVYRLGDELLVHEPGTVVTREATTGRSTALARQLAPWSVVLVRQDGGGPTSAYENPVTP
ncbi:GH39 family glycosyl hydrolase [Streptomyces phaeochromogenes]|uniref:GH39 family glycosyl hydrolase n=1 Tax=Streptomyces phaeochromogenes TaxID=1923 RepID=UPI0036A969B0